MSWAHCGTDSRGRAIGYAVSAQCDHPGCGASIDRGLSYACGGMHGENGADCEGYFCPAHLSTAVADEDRSIQVCDQCDAVLEADPDWQYDDEKGAWRQLPAEVSP